MPPIYGPHRSPCSSVRAGRLSSVGSGENSAVAVSSLPVIDDSVISDLAIDRPLDERQRRHSARTSGKCHR